MRLNKQSLDRLVEDILRGKHPGELGRLPDARFETPSNIAATRSLRFNLDGNPESKIFLGAVGGTVESGARLPDGRATRHVLGGLPIGVGDDRHIITIAGSRGGKGRSCLVPNLLLLPGSTSVFCVDPKGDLARITANYRASVLRQRVSLLDPFGVCGPDVSRFKASFNAIEILQRSDAKSFVPNAKLIADSLIVSGDFKDRHWDATAQQILAGLCGHVATHGRYDGHRNLITVWYLASELTSPDPDSPNRYWLETEMLANDAGGGMIRNAARSFYDRVGGEFSSVLSNLRKHLDWIGIECMADCLQQNSIDLRDLKRGSLAIYASLPAMRMADLSGWLRLLVQLTLAAHEEEPTVDPYRQTLLMLDEFNILGRLGCLEVAAAQIAGLGARIWAVAQDLSQIKSKYTSSWETFIANAGILQLFSLADTTTLEYVSKRLGYTSCLSRSTNVPTFEQASRNAATGESWSITSQPLMTAEEIGRFFSRDDRMLRQLILRPGFNPAILQRVFYDQHEWFRGMTDGA